MLIRSEKELRKYRKKYKHGRKVRMKSFRTENLNE